MLQPGFMVLQGNRLEDLRDLLTEVIRGWPLPPLAPEVILVQSNGMKHWLELALANHAGLGICAGTRIELPARFLWSAYRAVLGAQEVPDHLPFDKSALQWRLLRLLPTLAAQPGSPYAHLQRYLAGDADGRKRYQLALQIADVFDGYQSYRADWLADWAAGRDVLASEQPVTPMLAEQRWQASLWRDLVADVQLQSGASAANASRAALHQRFLSAMPALAARGQRPLGLPPRITVFGISSLPLQALQALAALGQFCQVLLLVHNPCQFHWGHLVEGREVLRRAQVRRQRHKPWPAGPAATVDPTLLHVQGHPLLASWGRQGRDYLHLLDEFDQPESYPLALQRVDLFHDTVAELGHGQTATRLQRLQSSVLQLEPLPPVPAAVPVDDSITLVSAHSALRELEVLHDHLLGWFDAEPELQPSDVIVMVPDMPTFAPAIAAVFGRFARGQPRHVPFSVADSTPRQAPLVLALETLLRLPQARFTLSEGLALLEVQAVRQRFELGLDDVAQLRRWLGDAGVRWGLDAAQRRAAGMAGDVPALDFNTWAFGLRRLLLGYASGPGEPWQGVLPLGSVGGLGAALVGRLLRWLDAIHVTLDDLQAPRAPDLWAASLQALLERFFSPADDAEERLLMGLQQPLLQWQQACAEAALVEPLPLLVVRDHWLAQLSAPGLQQRFFGGGVQFATLMPMRSIPYPVVCLLGMNDGDYPRAVAPRDFDLMAQHPQQGDRSRREDDRYLFLEALLSARRRLYLSWQGRRASDNAEQPPSVLVAQLIDWCKAAWTDPPQAQQQPLQAFSARYFEAGSPLRTYADDWQAVHHGADDGGASIPAQAQPSGATAAPVVEISLQQLQRLLRHPVQVFYRDRLGLRLDDPEAVADDSEPFALDGLQQYQLGEALLDAPDLDAALDALPLSGRLPLAGFGRREQVRLRERVTAVLERRAAWCEASPQRLPAQALEIALDRGVMLTGSVSGLRQGPAGWLLLRARPGAVLTGSGNKAVPRGETLVRLWVEHVAGSAMGWSLTSVMVGADAALSFAPMDALAARRLLNAWSQVYHAARAAPLPLACKTAFAWLNALAAPPVHEAGAGSDDDEQATDGAGAALAAARKVFDDGHDRKGEHQDSPYLRRAFDDFTPLQSGLPQWAGPLYGELLAWVRQIDRPLDMHALAEQATP